MNKIQLEKFIYNKPVETNQQKILEKLHYQYIRNKEMQNFLIDYFNSSINDAESTETTENDAEGTETTENENK